MVDLPALRAFSPVSARWLDGTPSLHAAVDEAPYPGLFQNGERVDLANARQALRTMRRQLVIHTAARELDGASPLDTARLWSQMADVALVFADGVAAVEVAQRFGTIDVGRATLALGKLGSEELNPSSDIDIVCVYGDDDAVSSTGVTAHEWHTHHARRLRSILADVDDDGFCFRVDFDLRPEGTRGPLVNSVDAVERYYERFGRVWERVALLRLRASVDVGGVGADVVRRLQPFVFRRSFDPRVVDELFAMKARLTDSAERETNGGFDLKRGRGGIREVEFMAQSLVLLHAGRIPALRALQAAPVVTLLDALEAQGLLPFRTTRDLVDAYTLLRRTEHAVMYGEDRQTQFLADDGDDRARVAAGVERGAGLMAGSFTALLATTTAAVHEAFVRHLGESRHEAPAPVRLALDLEEDDLARQSALARIGFSQPARGLELLRVLERRRGGPFSPLTRTDPRFSRFTERIVEHVGASVDPMAAIERLLDVFPGRAHPALLERLSDERTIAALTRLLALSAPLSRALGRLARIGRVDEALLFALDARRPSSQRLLGVMRGDVVAENDDDEAAVGRVWRAKQEALFAAALPFLARVQHGSTRVDDDGLLATATAVVDAQQRLSILADACLQRALELAERRLRRRHGQLAHARFAVFALGSLGGHELGFFRDLDLAFVYDVDDEDRCSDGARPVTAAEWATRLAQQVLWVLTSPTAADPLYPVDTRLRPSGSQGALTTSLARFRAYHAQESALWERQSLLRLRFVAGDSVLGRATVAVARDSLARGAPVDVGPRLLDMRSKMVGQRAARDGLDLKLGRGGIADVEFAVQGLQLMHAPADRGVLVPSTRRALARLARRGFIASDDAARLRLGLDRLVRVRELLHIVDDQRPAVIAVDDDRLAKLTAAGTLGDVTDPRLARQQIDETMSVVDDTTRRILSSLPTEPR